MPRTPAGLVELGSSGDGKTYYIQEIPGDRLDRWEAPAGYVVKTDCRLWVGSDAGYERRA